MLDFARVHQNRVYLESSREAAALTAFLVEAIRPISEAFGTEWYYAIEPVPCGEEPFLRVMICLPATYSGDPEAALKTFDASWWLTNYHRSPTGLVFDYCLEHADG